MLQQQCMSGRNGLLSLPNTLVNDGSADQLATTINCLAIRFVKNKIFSFGEWSKFSFLFTVQVDLLSAGWFEREGGPRGGLFNAVWVHNIKQKACQLSWTKIICSFSPVQHLLFGRYCKMLCKNKVMCQGMSEKKGHVISETTGSSMSLCTRSGSCCWDSRELQVLSWTPPEEPQAVGETFAFLKRIRLGSTQSSPHVLTATPCWEQPTRGFHSFPSTTFTLVENKRGRVMSRAKQAADRVRKGPWKVPEKEW